MYQIKTLEKIVGKAHARGAISDEELDYIDGHFAWIEDAADLLRTIASADPRDIIGSCKHEAEQRLKELEQ